MTHLTSKSKEIYDSYVMLHPDKTVMCYCSAKKARWYISRNLATWIDNKRFILNFIPDGKGKHDIAFYTNEMQNQCVVCGSKKNLTRHHIVPFLFRKNMPLEFKQNNHHDILPMCVMCHENYELSADKFKKELLSLNKFLCQEMTKEQKYNKKILSARDALKKHELGFNKNGLKVVIPEDRLNELKKLAQMPILQDYNKNLQNEKLQTWMAQLIREDKIFDFIKSWRFHFIENTNARFLPKHWSIEHPLEIIHKN